MVIVTQSSIEEVNMKNHTNHSIILDKAQKQIDTLQKEINVLQLLLNELKLSKQELPTIVPDHEDDKETANIQSFRSIKPQKENKDGYSFGDRVQITSKLSQKQNPFVQGFMPKKNMPKKQTRAAGTVVGTTLHYVDILLDNANNSIRKKNTSISLITKN